MTCPACNANVWRVIVGPFPGSICRGAVCQRIGGPARLLWLLRPSLLLMEGVTWTHRAPGFMGYLHALRRLYFR